ncbi:hypothetical protein Q8F55_002484 [Vanrija albida]|uniref:CxC1-like cysteine cluster associated with KDZ transposases domain-containing protein n=1 Tax=Vanrija albida TaxID=181172 RepID=A0ABR3QA14_9TREE
MNPIGPIDIFIPATDPMASFDEDARRLQQDLDPLSTIAMTHPNIWSRAHAADLHFVTLVYLVFRLYPLPVARIIVQSMQAVLRQYQLYAELTGTIDIALFNVCHFTYCPVDTAECPCHLQPPHKPHAPDFIRIQTTYLRFVKPAKSPSDFNSYIGLKRKREPEDEDEGGMAVAVASQ